MLAGTALRSAERSRGLERSLSGALCPRGSSVLGTEDTPVSVKSQLGLSAEAVCQPLPSFPFLTRQPLLSLQAVR